MLAFYSVARAALMVLTIVNDKHLDRASWSWKRAKGQRFPRGGKQRLWKYLKCHLPLSRSQNVVDIQNARAAVETKAVGRVKGCQVWAKSGYRREEQVTEANTSDPEP